MGIAYGSGAVPKKRLALLICAAGVFLGAVLGGGEVVKTLGSKIIPQSIVGVDIALIILASAALSLFIANLMGIPLSTSEVTVGAIVGVGVAFKIVYFGHLLIIVLWWLIVPIVALVLSYLADKGLKMSEKRLQFLQRGKWPKILTALVIFTGFAEAFSAGMNNVANSVGPLVAAGMLSINNGILIGGLFVAFGAMLLGGKVLETNGKKITDLSLLQGITVSGLGAGLVITASLFGIPVPQTQITTCSILGVGMSRKGREIWKKEVIERLLKVWVVSPFFSLIISYNLVKMFLEFDFYSVLISFCMFVATIGFVSLLRHTKREKQAFYKESINKSGGR